MEWSSRTWEGVEKGWEGKSREEVEVEEGEGDERNAVHRSKNARISLVSASAKWAINSSHAFLSAKSRSYSPIVSLERKREGHGTHGFGVRHRFSKVRHAFRGEVDQCAGVEEGRGIV